MAKGDLVGGTFVADGNYQPAAGVEVVINWLSETGVTENWYHYDGVQTIELIPASILIDNMLGVRIALNNTVYLRCNWTAGASTYGGIQTK